VNDTKATIAAWKIVLDHWQQAYWSAAHPSCNILLRRREAPSVNVSSVAVHLRLGDAIDEPRGAASGLRLLGRATRFAEELVRAAARPAELLVFTELSSLRDRTSDAILGDLQELLAKERKHGAQIPTFHFAPSALSAHGLARFEAKTSSGLPMTFVVGGNPLSALHCMAAADVFMPAKSSFSTVSAALSRGIKVVWDMNTLFRAPLAMAQRDLGQPYVYVSEGENELKEAARRVQALRKRRSRSASASS
jgi:hypothetical protein